MKIRSIEHWDKFVYGLLYPGFVGSMLYELILADKQQANAANYISVVYFIKVVITLFYCVDYLHLYGDMHEVTKDYKRDKIYIWCDILSSVFFFASFVAVKLEHYTWALIFISLVPVFFTAYKLRNIYDRKYQFKYTAGSLALAFILILCQKHCIRCSFFDNVTYNLLGFTIVSLVTYSYYVFCYYDKKSLKEDKEIYGYQSINEEKKQGTSWTKVLKNLISK